MCSVALVAQALAQSCRPYNIDLRGPGLDVTLRYQKLSDVLEKNPSFAEYTRELSLDVHCNPKPQDHYSSFYIDARNNQLSRFLSYFNRLEEFLIGQPEYPRLSHVTCRSRSTESLSGGHCADLGLQSLRTSEYFCRRKKDYSNIIDSRRSSSRAVKVLPQILSAPTSCCKPWPQAKAKERAAIQNLASRTSRSALVGDH